jgi:hypothetical protein
MFHNNKISTLLFIALLLITYTQCIKMNAQSFLGNSMVKLDENLLEDYIEDGDLSAMDVPKLYSELKSFMKEAEVVMSKIEQFEKQKEVPIVEINNDTVVVEGVVETTPVDQSLNTTEPIVEEKEKVLEFTINDRVYNITNAISRAPISEILTILNSEIGYLKDSYTNITSTGKETSSYIQELRELVTNITNKYNLYNLQKNHKIEIMNRKALDHLHLQLESAILSIQQNIEHEKEEISDYDIKIEEIIERLPSEDSTCQFLLQCGECVADPKCGWCASSNQCVEGNEFAPHKGQCSYYNFNKCSEEANCEDYKSCGDCLADVGCGWCNNLNNKICVRRTDGEQGLCRSSQFYHIWRHENNECPKVTLTNYFDYLNTEIEKVSKEVPEQVVRIDIPNINEIIELNEDLIDYYGKRRESEQTIELYEEEYNNTLENLECIEKEQNKTIFEEGWNSTVEQQAIEQNIVDISNLLENYIMNEMKYGNGTETMFGVSNDTVGIL